MRNYLLLTAILAASLSACSKSGTAAPTSASSTSSAPTTAASAPSDAVTSKLQDLAGGGATDCGRIKSLSGPEVQTGGECALSAAKAKRPFTIAYDMPGLTVGIAGDKNGKMSSISAQPGPDGKVNAADIKVVPCPAELRLAQSGRVTCFAPGSMGMGSSGANPHAGVPPAAPGSANPHATMPPKTF